MSHGSSERKNAPCTARPGKSQREVGRWSLVSIVVSITLWQIYEYWHVPPTSPHGDFAVKSRFGRQDGYSTKVVENTTQPLKVVVYVHGGAPRPSLIRSGTKMRIDDPRFGMFSEARLEALGC